MIKVSNLEYVYRKTNKKAIDNISFDIKKGEVFGFLGPSGAGKTTMQKILIGMLRNYTGSVKIMNRERRDWGKDFFERIGVAFDSPNLYQKLTAIENLRLINSYYKDGMENVNELLDRVGLLPDKDKKVEAYSKGMKMRLNFVRAIMHNPEILFFDELTSGLDPVNARIIKNIINELKHEGKTVFLTTHNMTVAGQLCDRVGFIIDGKVNIIDSPKELKVKYGKKSVRIEYYDKGTVENEEFDLTTIGRNDTALKILKSKKIKTIHSQEATLEDIFIKVTGRKLI